MIEYIKNIKLDFKWVAIIALLIFLAFSVNQCNNNKNKYNEESNLNTALNDSVRIYKDSEGRNHAESTPIYTAKPEDFISAATSNKAIKDLQELVSKYKKELLKPGNMAGIIASETKYDTIYKSKNSNTLDSINNKWINTTFGFRDGQTYYSLKTRDSLSFVIGEKSQGWFKKKLPFADVKSSNPYNEVKEFRTYQITQPKKKRFGIGPNISLGFDSELNKNIYIGIGANYNIIEF